MQRSPKVQKNQIIYLHPTGKMLLHHVTSGDAGVRKIGTNGMLRRKASIGSRRAGATGLATFSPRRSLRIQKKKKKKRKAEEPRPEAWSNGTRLISFRQW